MPWDDTALELHDVADDGAVTGCRVVAGGPRAGVSVQEPRFSPGGTLHWVDDTGGRWRLRRLGAGGAEEVWPAAPPDAEFGGPPSGTCTVEDFTARTCTNDLYGFLPGSETVVAAYSSGGRDHVA
eukprot:gene13675-2243_t